jgi:hypothetical protein
MDMKHGHATRMCGIDMDRRHRDGHVAWKWTCGMDMDMQCGHSAWTYVQHGNAEYVDMKHGHATWTYRKEVQHGYVA